MCLTVVPLYNDHTHSIPTLSRWRSNALQHHFATILVLQNLGIDGWHHLAAIQGYKLSKEITLAVLQYLQNSSAKQHQRKAKILSSTRPSQLRQERLSEGHALLDLGNGESRVETLGAGPAAVQNGVATVQAHAVVEAVHALGGPLVTRVGDPAV